MYLLTTLKNSNGILSFDYASAPGYDLFFEGTDLSGICFDLKYQVKRRGGAKQLKSFHLIQSDGPELVSDRLRAIIERYVPDEVDFFEPRIFFGEEQIKGFSAINVKSKISCMDLEASEYRQTNFDPVSPVYLFTYMKLLESNLRDVEICRCAEHAGYIIFGEALMAACIEAGIKGLMFCRAIDMTYENRSICENS